MSEHLCFIADVMLGSLAKWLRMFGFDTRYFRDIGDNEVVRIALQEDRIILTRDKALARKRGAGRAILVESEDLREQLKQVLKAVMTSDGPLGAMAREGRSHAATLPGRPRCPRCNGTLSAEEREAVSNDVPEYVFLSQQSFFRCRRCGKVYWEGSHKRLIDKTIMALSRELGAPPRTP